MPTHGLHVLVSREKKEPKVSAMFLVLFKSCERSLWLIFVGGERERESERFSSCLILQGLTWVSVLVVLAKTKTKSC